MRTHAHQSTPVSLELEVRPEAIAVARDLVRRTLMDHAQVEDAALAVSELMTNVIRHASAAATATIVIENPAANAIRISVRQASGSIDELMPEPGEGGHGLKIVEAVTERWGVERDSWLGVWFEIAS